MSCGRCGSDENVANMVVQVSPTERWEGVLCETCRRRVWSRLTFVRAEPKTMDDFRAIQSRGEVPQEFNVSFPPTDAERKEGYLGNLQPHAEDRYFNRCTCRRCLNHFAAVPD